MGIAHDVASQSVGRIHRYGQKYDCLIFNFVATNTIEGRVLHRLLEKLQEIRNALDDDAVFNVVGEVLPAAHKPFDDPIGKDAIIQWPGGVNTQLYWHTTAPSYKP